MKLLLDTHTLIWWDGDTGRLSDRAQAAIADAIETPGDRVLASVVSAWEIQIKHQLGRLALHRPLPVLLDQQRVTNALQILPVSLAHVFALDSLPLHHRDPFDRLLLAQAHVEDAMLVSTDAAFAAYDVPTLW